MPDITHIEWAEFAGVGRLGEWLGRRCMRKEASEERGVIVGVAQGPRSESRSESKFDSRIKV